MTPDTFSQIYSGLSEQLDLFGASLKMSKDTSPWDMTRFTKAFGIWVTELRQDYTQRKKLAHLTVEKDSLYWGTPNTMDHLPSRSKEAMKHQATNGQRKNRKRPGNLREQIDPLMQEAYNEAREETNKKSWGTPRVPTNNGISSTPDMKKSRLEDQVIVNWPTPTSIITEEDIEMFKARQIRLKKRHGKRTGNGCGMNLGVAVKQWPTPAASEVRQGYQKRSRGKKGNQKSLTTIVLDGQPGQENNNTSGKSQEQLQKKNLNPIWVAQLMGTTLEQTFFVCTVTRSYHKP